MGSAVSTTYKGIRSKKSQRLTQAPVILPARDTSPSRQHHRGRNVFKLRQILRVKHRPSPREIPAWHVDTEEKVQPPLDLDNYAEPPPWREGDEDIFEEPEVCERAGPGSGTTLDVRCSYSPGVDGGPQKVVSRVDMRQKSPVVVTSSEADMPDQTPTFRLIAGTYITF
ncbi:hypothetical protein AK830_g3930 [Neonectria ditissima]|uniref:Uncharacterized protein n=1 Tax=Neonectria ditissima TaxID=78410 RepID=A0A0N8H7T2_9HYPO|nr:hypothetical protein AK830_g3930 [Neonectria ditissima]